VEFTQYAWADYRHLLDAHGIECSMSRRANCWDNAVVESFFATLKTELIHHADYPSPAEARAAIFEFIEVFYNRQRRHSTLGYQTPAGFERMARAAYLTNLSTKPGQVHTWISSFWAASVCR